MKSILPLALLCSIAMLLPSSISQSIPAHILAENLQQEVNSVALTWVEADKNFSDYEYAVIGGYETDLTDTNSIKKPVYICKATQSSLWVTGHLRPSDRKCLVAVYGYVHHISEYQVLINIENSARLSWVKRDKYTPETQGTVIGGDIPRNYVGRMPLSNTKLSHILGYLDPYRDFGKYPFVDETNEQMESEDGKVLVETEPIAYELRNIKYEDLHMPQVSEERILRSTVLKNDALDEASNVHSAMSYNVAHNMSWGHGHGLLVGLPLHAYLKNGVIKESRWGVNHVSPKSDVQKIEYFLAAGTAVNVTLTAKYINSDIPYSATLVSLYKDGKTTKTIIKDSLRESRVKDIYADYSPVYFLSNNSFVTTTTTTISTQNASVSSASAREMFMLSTILLLIVRST